MKIDDIDDLTYILVRWPHSQVLMDYPWFDAETSLADHSKYSNSAYFVPKTRYEEYLKDEQAKIIYKTSGACIMWDGKICKSNEFTSRMKYKDSKYKPTQQELERIKQLPFTDIARVYEIENPDVHEWYEIGSDKYGRAMYCPKTDIKRNTTMGEFYQNATVD